MKMDGIDMDFEFATASRIIFGEGTLRKSAHVIAEMNNRVVLITGRNNDRANLLMEIFDNMNIYHAIYNVRSEPTTETVMEGVRKAQENDCNVVVGLGGGSALDTGKAIAALLTNSGNILDYLEVIGKGKLLTKPSAKYVAIPTTSGTGTEVTKNAVISSDEYRVKVSMRSPWMLPQIAVIDPLLTHSVSPETTVSTGLDALTQLIEPYVSIKSNPLTDGFCREGIIRIGKSLKKVCLNGNDGEARVDMAFASLLGGLALANAKLGAVHGIAGSLGGMCPIPHGVACARLLPLVMKTNVHSLMTEGDQILTIDRYNKIAQWLTGKEDAGWSDGIKWIDNLVQQFKIPSLCHYGLQKKEIPQLIKRSQKASSMKGNPVILNDKELNQIIMSAY